jgi:hypothetical protein
MVVAASRLTAAEHGDAACSAASLRTCRACGDGWRVLVDEWRAFGDPLWPTLADRSIRNPNNRVVRRRPVSIEQGHHVTSRWSRASCM